MEHAPALLPTISIPIPVMLAILAVVGVLVLGTLSVQVVRVGSSLSMAFQAPVWILVELVDMH